MKLVLFYLTVSVLTITGQAKHLRNAQRELNPGQGQGPPNDNPGQGHGPYDNPGQGQGPPDELPPTAQEAQVRRDALKSYLEGRRNKLKVKATTKTRSGQVIDWIDPADQVPGRTIADPPPFSIDGDGGRQLEEGGPDEEMAFELQEQPEARGPEGTVPIARRDVADRLEDHELPHSVDDFLSKYGDASDDEVPDPTDPHGGRRLAPGRHEYVSTRENADIFGGHGKINVWNPYVYKSAEFSLGQTAVITGSGSSMQAVEVGWQDCKLLYGDNYPHLFIFYRTAGSLKGDNKGGYNRDVDGWVQVSNEIFPEARRTSVSSIGGTQYVMTIRVHLYQGNWWIGINDVWMGYYPASLFSDPGLRYGGKRIDWYGEIIDDQNDSIKTYTDMGSGQFASEGWQHAAYMRALRTYHKDCNCWRHFDIDYTGVTNSRCYSIDAHDDNRGSWGSYFYWGGPGRNSQCT